MSPSITAEALLVSSPVLTSFTYNEARCTMSRQYLASHTACAQRTTQSKYIRILYWGLS